MICKKCGNEFNTGGPMNGCLRFYRNTQSQEWVAKNKEKRKLILKKSHEKNREKVLTYKREYYLKNKEKYVEYGKKLSREVRQGIKYRYRTRKQENGIVKYNVKDMFERDDYTCRYCGNEAKELDHIIPISRGGEDSPNNVASSCVSCNRRKHIKTSTEFMKPVFVGLVKQLREFN